MLFLEKIKVKGMEERRNYVLLTLEDSSTTGEIQEDGIEKKI